MKINIYNSPYIEIFLFKEANIMTHVWKPATIHFTDEEYKAEYQRIIKSLLKLPAIPQKTIIDLREFYFALSPEMQDWHGENVFSILYNLGEFYLAVINSPDFIVTVYVEQTFEEFNEKKLKITRKHFENLEEAKIWLSGIK
ncbi:hypothetical protein BKI52_00200 [marine bacterium AO1-C]|nr:hypothetical protein BKI52_00200 [marine bacterium AO1-C]